MGTLLRIDGVHAAYKKKDVIRGVSLSARRGQAIAIIGPNGAGKSTLLRVVAGFLETSRGRVLVGEADVSRLAPHERARLGVSYLMQGGRVFPSLTVAENLEMAALALARGARAERIAEVVEMLTLREALGRRVDALSGGWKHRLALAMAFVGRPSVLLLDEPTAGLSPALTRHVFRVLEQYLQEGETTILLVEQNVQVALGFAHRAVVISDGKITAETKRPAQWLAEGVLDSLFWGRSPGGAARP